MTELKLEMSDNYYQPDKSHIEGTNIMITPALGGENWVFRVRMSETQSLLAFKKFMTIGIGFDVEEDWNTNLPWSNDIMAIWEHIRCNKGDDGILDSDCIRAIEMLQDAVEEHKDDLGVL